MCFALMTLCVADVANTIVGVYSQGNYSRMNCTPSDDDVFVAGGPWVGVVHLVVLPWVMIPQCSTDSGGYGEQGLRRRDAWVGLDIYR